MPDQKHAFGIQFRLILFLLYERLYFVPYAKICSKTAACKLFRPSLFRRSLAAIFSLTRNFIQRCRGRFRQKIVEIGAILAIFAFGNHTLSWLGTTQSLQAAVIKAETKYKRSYVKSINLEVISKNSDTHFSSLLVSS